MIELNKKWAIGADNMNIILYRKRKVKKAGVEPAWGVDGYYSSLHNALKGLADKEILDTSLKSLVAVEAKLNKLYGLIESLPNITIGGLKRGLNGS